VFSIISKDKPTSKFGEALKNQIEERLSFYEHGTAVTKNIDVINKAIQELDAMEVDEESDKKVEIVLGKRKASPEPQEVSPKKHKDMGSDNVSVKSEEDEDENAESKKSTKKKKNKKKNKKSSAEKNQEAALKKAETEKETKNDDTPSKANSEKDKFVLVVPDYDKETPKSSKKKDKKEAATIQDTPKTDKKEKKGEELLTQETPKSDKKKKKKDKGEVITINETPKSDKKKDEKNKESPKSDKKKQDSTETPKSDKKKKKKLNI
jgi:nucleolar protein 56